MRLPTEQHNIHQTCYNRTMTTAVDETEQRFMLDMVEWDAYESFLRGLDNRHVFLTYDEGRMELMSPSWSHDRSAELIGIFIRVLAEETSTPIIGGGSTTFKRRDLRKGLEPDRCFYVRNEPRIRGKRNVDLAHDPPPDIVIEVEISARLLDRVGIYAAMGVAELWRYDGRQLTIESLKHGGYQRVERSPSFPKVDPARIAAFVEDAFEIDETTWLRQVRQWVRDTIVKSTDPE